MRRYIHFAVLALLVCCTAHCLAQGPGKTSGKSGGTQTAAAPAPNMNGADWSAAWAGWAQAGVGAQAAKATEDAANAAWFAFRAAAVDVVATVILLVISALQLRQSGKGASAAKDQFDQQLAAAAAALTVAKEQADQQAKDAEQSADLSRQQIADAADGLKEQIHQQEKARLLSVVPRITIETLNVLPRERNPSGLWSLEVFLLNIGNTRCISVRYKIKVEGLGINEPPYVSKVVKNLEPYDGTPKNLVPVALGIRDDEARYLFPGNQPTGGIATILVQYVNYFDVTFMTVARYKMEFTNGSFHPEPLQDGLAERYYCLDYESPASIKADYSGIDLVHLAPWEYPNTWPTC